MDQLYHGSSFKVDVLQPRKASDCFFSLGNLKGVYATSSKDVALAFALGAIPDETGSVSRFMKREKDKQVKMIYALGHPNFGGKGYLYVLSKKNFDYLKGSIWISKKSVIPLEVIEIEVDDHLHLFRYATEKEKEEIMKEIEKNK